MILTSQVYGKITYSFLDLFIHSNYLIVCESTLQSLMWHRKIYSYLYQLQQWVWRRNSPLSLALNGVLTLLLGFILLATFLTLDLFT